MGNVSLNSISKDLVDIRKVQDMLLFTTLKTQIRDL